MKSSHDIFVTSVQLKLLRDSVVTDYRPVRYIIRRYWSLLFYKKLWKWLNNKYKMFTLKKLSKEVFYSCLFLLFHNIHSRGKLKKYLQDNVSNKILNSSFFDKTALIYKNNKKKLVLIWFFNPIDYNGVHLVNMCIYMAIHQRVLIKNDRETICTTCPDYLFSSQSRWMSR